MQYIRFSFALGLLMLASCGSDSSTGQSGDDFDLTTCSGLCESGGFADAEEESQDDKNTCACFEAEDANAALDLGNCQDYCAAAFPSGAQTEIADDSESCTCHAD